MVAPTLKNMILCRGELRSPVFVIGNRLFSGRRERHPLQSKSKFCRGQPPGRPALKNLSQIKHRRERPNGNSRRHYYVLIVFC